MNENTLIGAVENSLKNGLEGKVWMFRTFRDIISGKGGKEVEVREKWKRV